MWSDEVSTYSYNSKQNEAIQKADDQLKSEISELKKEIETNELIHGIGFVRPFCSVPTPRDPKIAERERKVYIEKLMRVYDVRPIYIQANIMQEQIENANRDEYTMESLPIILHQFFLDKLSWSINAKHLHMLRWKRFSEHTSRIEEMFPEYKSRLSFILSDYNDSVKRAERLSVAREALLITGSCASAYTAIERDDLEIYLRWLICHFYSQKTFQQVMKAIEWLPIQMSTEHFASFKSPSNTTNASSSSQDGNDKERNLESLYRGQTSDVSSYNYSSNQSVSMASVLFSKYMKLDHVFLPSCDAQYPRDEVLNTISYMFNQDEVPMHNNSLEFLQPRLRYLVSLYKINYDLSRLTSSGDEMELYAEVSRRFKVLFAQQEQMKKFRIYDLTESGAESWGSESPLQALKKEANWIDFIQIKPNKDPIFEKDMAKLRLKNLIDQFLLPHNSFLEVNNDERVADCLRENASVHKSSSNSDSSLSLHTQTVSFNTSALWKRIFYNPNLNKKDEHGFDMTPLDRINGDNMQAKTTISFRAKPANKKQDDFNFVENLQKLGLDDTKESDTNLSNVQGSYLAFLLLRHLRIRDLKRQALSLLNYFRSIEKTITIYDGGLSAEAKGFKRQSAQNHSKETSYGNNLGYHSYMFNTPKDFRISENEFIEYSEIENHDDYYKVDDKGLIHVQDQRGYYVMYDAALGDLKSLESDLLLIASYYIAKEKESIFALYNPRSKTDINLKRAKRSNAAIPELNAIPPNSLGGYSHLNVDRFAVLCDAWTNEINFLEMKKNLLNVYFEAYQNVFDVNERRNLAQNITDLIYKRARLDFNANYFTQSYRSEVSSLYKQCLIVKTIRNKMVNEMRALVDRPEFNTNKYGLPFLVIKKNQIFLTPVAEHEKPDKKDDKLKDLLYLLEFHPCLASLSRLPDAFKYALEELNHFKATNSVNERLSLEIAYFTQLNDSITNMNTPGSSFAPNIHKEVFGNTFVDDPFLMGGFVDWMYRQLEDQVKNKTKKEQHEMLTGSLVKIIEMVTLRHRLVTAGMDTEILSKIYKKQSNEMGFEDFHMFQRYIQLDFAKYKDNASDPPPMFVGELNMEDPSIDRFMPNNLSWAISELEEGPMARLSFKAKENIEQLCLRPGGIENLQLILRLQLAHNNALISSVMQANYCYMSLNLAPRLTKHHLKESAQNKQDNSKYYLQKFVNKTEEINLFKSGAVSSTPSNVLMDSSNRLKQFSESFVSLQIEKNQLRDLLINDFIRQKQQKGSLLLSNQNEMEKLKRKLFNDFANRLTCRISQYSLRTQLIALYYSITKLLENFPNTRENHFVFGEPFEKRNQKTSPKASISSATQDESSTEKHEVDEENAEYIKPDAHVFKKRPRKLLSDDGERVLNLWFIPHFTETLTMFKRRNDDFSVRTLKICVRIIAALNEILQFIYAMACLNVAVISSASNNNSSGNNSGSDNSTAQIRRKLDLSTWENSGGLENELNEIQLEMNQLDDPCDPEQVADLLETKRSALFLQFDCAVRYAVQHLFLANGNAESYRLISENMNFSLKFLNDYAFDTSENVYMNLPDPFDFRDHYALKLIPYRTFISKNGPFPMHYWQWYLIEQNITLCLNGLKDVEKNMANGEMLGVMLMMEDLVLNKSESLNELMQSRSSTATTLPVKNASQSNRNSRLSITAPTTNLEETDSNETSNALVPRSADSAKKKSRLIMNYKKWHFFLITWKRLEILKFDWARRKLGVENINTCEMYSKYSENYRKEILLPVLKILVKSTDHQDIYDNIVDFKQPLLLPPEVSELESKVKQIVRLLEKLELNMIDETLHRVQRENKQCVSERTREENSLTTDLWKKSIMKEEFTINKPHIANDFTNMLYKKIKSTEQNGNIMHQISENDLKECLIKLGSMVQERERYNYEQYTLFYENLLRNFHQQLYSKEREVVYLKNSIEKLQNEINVEVQCQMADSCFNLITEVTALRSKLLELEMDRKKLEVELREKIKSEFIDLITDLVRVNTSLKSHIDKFKEDIHLNVIELLTNARKTIFDEVINLKLKNGVEIDQKVKEAQENQIALIQEISTQRNDLANLFLLQKTFTKLRLYKTSSSYQKQINELTETTNKIKKKSVDNTLGLEQQQQLIIQQKHAIKKQLAKLDGEYTVLKLKLEKELKEKQNREHEAQQRMKNERSLNSAKQFNVEKLFEELTQKDLELRQLHLVTEKTTKMQSINDMKIQREVTNLKRSLVHERNLKLDAFQKVDQLQTHVFDLEDEMTNKAQNSRPQTSTAEKGIKNALRSNLTSSLNLQSSKHSSPFPRLSSGVNLTQSTSSSSATANGGGVVVSFQDNKPLVRPKTGFAKYKSSELSRSSSEMASCVDRQLIYKEKITKIGLKN